MNWLTFMENMCHILTIVGELRCSGTVVSVCSASGTCRVNLAITSMISYEWWKDCEVITTSRTYPWSYVTHIFHKGQLCFIPWKGEVKSEILRQINDFNFPIVNFPFLCSNIPSAPAYGVYITYPWSYVTQIFHRGQPSHGCDRKMFEVMTST
jgi:hypothetical protein